MSGTKESPSGSSSPANGKNPYDRKLGQSGFDKTPHCIYFYYITKAPDGGWDYRHYYDTNNNKPVTNLKASILSLVRNARERGNKPPQCGVGRDHLVWTRVSYVVYFVDDEAARFRPGDAVTFDSLGEPNNSFFDAWDDQLDLGGANGKRATFAFLNHMKRDAAGNTLGSETQRFRFHFNAPPGLDKSLAYPDSGGTNMGPPVPPPAA